MKKLSPEDSAKLQRLESELQSEKDLRSANPQHNFLSNPIPKLKEEIENLKSKYGIK